MSRLLSLFLCVLTMLPLAAHADTWSPSVRKSLAAALECRSLLASNAPALASLTPLPAATGRQGHQALPPENFRLFGLPVHKIWLFHDGGNKAASMVAIAAFQENVDWKHLVRAARLHEESLMGETAFVRQTAIGLLEGWREKPFWVEQAEASQPAAAKARHVYLACGTGGETTNVLPLRPEARKP
ncbi:MAG: hypothetical protein LBR88_07280 [Zoogloeaceae bacterium]|jgi:hypothetical protein|nr:hypothetical protein [Zoogloeaceae bacterium]